MARFIKTYPVNVKVIKSEKIKGNYRIEYTWSYAYSINGKTFSDSGKNFAWSIK